MVQMSLEIVYLVTGVITVVVASPLQSSRTKRSHLGSHQINNGQYAWICPSVVCHPVSPSCMDVESIVFSYSFPNAVGKLVEVSCESCSYCLDMPGYGRRIKKRSIDSLFAHESGRHPKGCRHLHCPSLPLSCENVKVANVMLHGHHCRRCPACFDGTIVNSLN